MSVTLPDDALDPLVRKLGEVAGLLSGSASVRDEFLAHPIDELSNALKDRQQELIELLAMILGDTDAETLGMPAAGIEDHWIPIRDGSGEPTGLFIVLARTPPSLVVGLGWKWEVVESSVTVRAWAHVPLFKTAGTAATTRVAVGSDEAPVRVAGEVLLEDGFGVSGMRFRGVRASLAVSGASAPPDVALVLLGLQIGDAAPQDRSLADLASLAPSTWIETALALFTTQLAAASSGSPASIVNEYVLPLLGITAPAPIPRLAWEAVPGRGSAVFGDWLAALTDSPDAMRAWLGRWQGLLQSGAGLPRTPSVSGSGTRTDPWRASVTIAGNVRVSPTAALETRNDGARVLYLGMRTASAEFAIGTSALRLELAANTELVAIPVGSEAPVQSLPSLSVLLRLFSSVGTIVTRTFAGGDPLSSLGTLSVGSLEAGLLLDGTGHPHPHIAMRSVQCARGTWDTIDLSSADALIDGIGGAASNLIQQAIEQGLALATPGPHAGRRVAALLGLVAPSAAGAPTPWPVTLTSSSSRITAFLGNPLAAVARYHAECLTTVISGTPAWRFLLAELGELLRDAGAVALPDAAPISGSGSEASPWSLVIGRTSRGDIAVRASFAMLAARPQLSFGIAFEPRPVPATDASFALSFFAELFRVSLPVASSDAASAAWLPTLQARAQLASVNGLEARSLGALRIGADAVSLALRYASARGASWELVVRAPWAAWDGAGAAVLMLPDLVVDERGMPAWNLAAADLGGALGSVQRDAVAELSRFIIGHLALEHGGPVGFALSALLGLLPGDPAIVLPEWRGGESGFALPPDFPVLLPANWSAFFANPWPEVRAHLRRLLAEPRFTAPVLQWLRAAMQGLAPQRGGSWKPLTFDEAVGNTLRFVPPDGLGNSDAAHEREDEPLAFPTLESLPFAVGGNGSYQRPYTVALRDASARTTEALVWLDPDGPPAGSAVDVALAAVAPALRDATGLEGASLEALLDVLKALTRVDEGLANALAGITPATLGESLAALDAFLANSDGVVLTASQQPADATWVRPAPLEASHVGALESPAVVAAITSQLAAWDAGASLPVLLLGAPFERNGAWSTVATAIGGSATSFSYRVAGTAPHAVSLLALSASARTIAAELAAYDGSPGLTASQRLVPVDAAAGSSSQAEQVVRLIERVRTFQPGKRVIIVAHSSSGLAARAAVQRAGMTAAVRGIITVGTPHIGSALPWAGSATLAEAIGALQRMSESVDAGTTLRPALDALWRFVRGRDLSDAPLEWPAHAFAPIGPLALPAGMNGLAIATRLPAFGLRTAMARSIASRLTALRTALSSRAPVQHIGVGLSTTAGSDADASVGVAIRTRLDLAEIRVAGSDAPRQAPRLSIIATLRRRDGWLAGTPDSRVRVRWAELGCEITANAVIPRVTLHDASVDGVERAVATLHRLQDGTWQADDVLAPALDSLLLALTASPSANADVLSLARLLSWFDVTKPRAADEGGGYAINPDGWSAALADAREAMRRVLATVLADPVRRTDFVTALRETLALSDTGLSRLFSDAASDTAEWRALRSLLRAVGLLDTEARGSVPVIGAWLELVRSPASYLEAHVAAVVRDAGSRLALLSELREILGVRDVGSPVVERELGAGVRIRVESLGRVSLRIAASEPLALGAAFSMSGALEMDLANGTCTVDVRLQPAGVTTALRWHFTLPAGTGGATWDIALAFGDGVRESPLADLPLYPVPPDFTSRVGALLPRITASTIATALLDSLVLPQLPEFAVALSLLGLVETPAGGRPRIRNLSRLVADPIGWLTSARALGNTTESALDPARIVAVVREVAAVLRLTDGTGAIALPFGLRVTTSASPSARLSFDMPSPLALGSGITAVVDASLGWSATGAPGASASIDLRAPMPGGAPWPTLRVAVGNENGGFRVALGAEDSMLQLLPFTGFGADAIGAAAKRLLPTLLDATLDAIAANGNADAAAFVSRVRAAAASLDANTLAGLDAIVSDPIAWVRNRFSSSNAATSASALQSVLAGVPGVSVAGGKLQFQPAGSPVTITLGRNGVIGAGLTLSSLDLGPLTMSAAFSAGISDSGSIAAVVSGTLDLSIDEGVIKPGGVSIRPSLHLHIGTSGASLRLYPIGNAAGSPDFRADVLPTFTFGVDDGGSLQLALADFARRVLIPVVLESFLDTTAVTTWLNTDIHAGLKPSAVLRDAGLLVSDGGGGWNLVAIDTLANPLRIVEGLVGAALRSTSGAFGSSPIIDFSATSGAGAGLFGASATSGASTRYGVRVSLPELRLGDDPEVIVRLGGRSDWIAAAGGPAGVQAGFTLLVVRDDGAGASPRFTLDPQLELAGVGISVSGRVDEPLFDSNGFRLGGLEALLFLRVSNLLSTPDVKFGLYGDISKVAVPLGVSDSNPVAASLMRGGGSGGDNQPVNPEFSVRAAYVQNLWVELGGERRNEVWFPIQRTFGPVSIQQIGVRWIGGPASKLAVLLDGGVALAGLAVGVDDLSLTMPLARISRVNEWELGLRGLAVSYNAAGVKIAGGLLQASDEIRYDGFLLIEVAGRSFVAFGSYGVVEGDTSLFVFLVVGIPIGGPPYFFITGLAGGFGYNRGLTVPAIESVPEFPLVSAMSDPGAVTADPMGFLRGLGPAFPMERGSYWFAAGIKFTSFTLVNSQALLYVLLNRGLEIGVLGMSQMQLPPALPLVSVELALKARFSTVENVLSVEARLTDNSWLLSRDCRLTGGFAFFLWFGGEHAGDFVISMGGYHPRYTKPAHYPAVPRLGFNWRVSGSITIKGESYFALTPREVMAGGVLEAVYKSGDVRAWFTAFANMYIQWRPFWFEVDIGVTIGVAVDTWLGTAHASTDATLSIWGPDIGGRATVDLWIVSFTIGFGAAYNKPNDKLSWAQFRTTLLPAEDEKLYGGNVERGLISGSPASGPWTVLPEFILRTEVFLGTALVQFGTAAAAASGAPVQIDIRPMGTPVNVASIHKVRVIRVRDGQDVTSRFQAREVLRGNVPRALWDSDESEPSRSVMPAVIGSRLVAQFDEARLDSTGRIRWTKLFETGRRHPLPFVTELEDRGIMVDPAHSSNQFDPFVLHATSALLAASTVLGGNAWRDRRTATLDALAREGVRVAPAERKGDVIPRGTFRRGRRSSPPLVRSLHEGLAGEPTPSVPRTEHAPIPVAEAKPVEPRATLDAVIRQRAEPTRSTAPAIRTTVDVSRLGRNAVAADMRALLHSPLAGAAVILQPAAQAARESTIARSSRALMRSGGAGRDAAMLDKLDASAWNDGTGVTDSAPLAQRRPGIPVDPGSALRFTLPTRNVTGTARDLVLAGDSATRVTALDRGGKALLDIENVGPLRVAIPEGTATLVVLGLGRSSLKETPREPGAVTLREATSAVPVVGWQSQSELVVVGPATLLARGALVTLGSSMSRASETGTVIASVVTGDQLGVTTTLPAGVRCVAVVLDETSEASAAVAADSIAVSARRAVLSDTPIVLASGTRTVLLYDVVATDQGARSIEVPVACDRSFTLCGVMGFLDSAEKWATLLGTADLDALVENGPLTPTGVATLRFVPRASNDPPPVVQPPVVQPPVAQPPVAQPPVVQPPVVQPPVVHPPVVHPPVVQPPIVRPPNVHVNREKGSD